MSAAVNTWLCTQWTHLLASPLGALLCCSIPSTWRGLWLHPLLVTSRRSTESHQLWAKPVPQTVALSPDLWKRTQRRKRSGHWCCNARHLQCGPHAWLVGTASQSRWPTVRTVAPPGIQSQPRAGSWMALFCKQIKYMYCDMYLWHASSNVDGLMVGLTQLVPKSTWVLLFLVSSSILFSYICIYLI